MNKLPDPLLPEGVATGSVTIGTVRFDIATGLLQTSDGDAVPLRSQSKEVLRRLALCPGKVVPRDALSRAVWGDAVVTDDSLVQCIADIRRAIGDRDRSILQTVPRKGYRLIAPTAARNPPATPARWRRKSAWVVLAGLAFVTVLGAMLALAPRPGGMQNPRIAVLPFEDLTGDPRWARLGRGISIDVARYLAREPGIGVIGSETAHALAGPAALDEARALDVAFLLTGEIEAREGNIAISVELTGVASRELLWSQRWVRPEEAYAEIRDDIVARVNASLVATFWFGAINRAVAVQAREKPQHRLSAYEQYLMGIENILWRAPDYAVALAHFRRAVDLEPGYARAWMMIGTMQQWIGDVSPEPMRSELHARSFEAFRTAYAHEPNDAMVQLTMSPVHLADGDAEAARRAVRRAVDLAPNQSDVLALAAWQSIAVGIAGPEPLAWASRALDLNPEGPPWHRLGLGMAAFAAGDYAATVAAMREAPPHHKKFLFLAAAHVLLGDIEAARGEARTLRDLFPDYTLAGDYDIPTNAALDRLRLAAATVDIR
jgi:TolB-like protein/DNA-binding winged helix-turn-helix (wHTH) protein